MDPLWNLLADCAVDKHWRMLLLAAAMPLLVYVWWTEGLKKLFLTVLALLGVQVAFGGLPNHLWNTRPDLQAQPENPPVSRAVQVYQPREPVPQIIPVQCLDSSPDCPEPWFFRELFSNLHSREAAIVEQCEVLVRHELPKFRKIDEYKVVELTWSNNAWEQLSTVGEEYRLRDSIARTSMDKALQHFQDRAWAAGQSTEDVIQQLGKEPPTPFRIFCSLTTELLELQTMYLNESALSRLENTTFVSFHRATTNTLREMHKAWYSKERSLWCWGLECDGLVMFGTPEPDRAVARTIIRAQRTADYQSFMRSKGLAKYVTVERASEETLDFLRHSFCGSAEKEEKALRDGLVDAPMDVYVGYHTGQRIMLTGASGVYHVGGILRQGAYVRLGIVEPERVTPHREASHVQAQSLTPLASEIE